MVIAGWQNGDYASTTTNITLDKVQLLTLFSTMLGIERTVSLARRAWGESTLISLIPFVQKAAVPAATRQMEGWNKQIVEDLRTALSKLAPEEVAESMEQVTLTRFNARSFFGLVLLVIAVYVMLTQMRPDEMIRAVKQANLWWAFVVMLFGFLAWWVRPWPSAPSWTGTAAGLSVCSARRLPPDSLRCRCLPASARPL